MSPYLPRRDRITPDPSKNIRPWSQIASRHARPAWRAWCCAPPDVLRLRVSLLQHLLDKLPHLRRTEGFRQTGDLSLFEKRTRFLTERISSEENHPPEQVRLLLLQCLIEPRAIQFRHAEITEYEIIGLCVQHGQRELPMRRRVHGMAVSAQQMG